MQFDNCLRFLGEHTVYAVKEYHDYGNMQIYTRSFSRSSYSSTLYLHKRVQSYLDCRQVWISQSSHVYYWACLYFHSDLFIQFYHNPWKLLENRLLLSSNNQCSTNLQLQVQLSLRNAQILSSELQTRGSQIVADYYLQARVCRRKAQVALESSHDG